MGVTITFSLQCTFVQFREIIVVRSQLEILHKDDGNFTDHARPIGYWPAVQDEVLVVVLTHNT